MEFYWIGVRIFLSKKFYSQYRMFSHKFFNFWCFVICGMIHKENNRLYFVSFCVSNQITEMLPKFNIPPSFEAIPDYFLIRPYETNKKITPSSISQCWNLQSLSSLCPASLDARKKFYPFFILKNENYLFFLRAGAIRL